MDSGMRGPYRVVKTLPHGRYELELLAGSYGKSTQAAAEFIIPWRGEWTPDVCAAYFSDADIDTEVEEESTSAVAEPLPHAEEPLPEDSSWSVSIDPSTSAMHTPVAQPENRTVSMPILETDLES